jgi:uncharacterized protein (DUF2062 family)
MGRFKELAKQLLHIEDTPERTALAFSIGVLFGFSPFLGFHTIGGIATAFLFRLNRLALLIGVWTNTPWWMVPYYTVATWVGTKMTGFEIDIALLKRIFQLGLNEGFFRSTFWNQLVSQGGLLSSFLIGSMVMALALALTAYPLCLQWIKFYRSRKDPDSNPNFQNPNPK